MAKESKKDVRASTTSKDSDVEKALHQIAKEEAFVLSNIRWRSRYSREMAGKLINLCVAMEVLSVLSLGYGFWTIRSKYLTWKLVALMVLPLFLTPVLCFITHLVSRTMYRIFDLIAQRELRKLRAKRRKLKEKTNDRTTQMYNPSGESNGVEVASAHTRVRNRKNPTGESNGVEVASTSTGVRNRKAPYVKFQGLRGKSA